MKALAAVFIVLELAAAFWLAAVARHGPAGLAGFALGYLVVAIALTVWAAKRFASAARFAALGVALLALAPVLLLVLDRIESASRESRIAATRVSDARDEPIVSRRGNVIGVRFSFAAQLPGKASYAIFPMLRSSHPAEGALPLSWTRKRVDGGHEPAQLGAGRHVFEFELYPAILTTTLRDEQCLSAAPAPTAPEPAAPAPLIVEIWDTPYGVTWRGGRQETTRQAYSVAAMYRAVLAEGFPKCPAAGG